MLAWLTHILPGISIHALREEGDFRALPLPVHSSIFLSTPSARRATRNDFRRPTL